MLNHLGQNLVGEIAGNCRAILGIFPTNDSPKWFNMWQGYGTAFCSPFKHGEQQISRQAGHWLLSRTHTAVDSTAKIAMCISRCCTLFRSICGVPGFWLIRTSEILPIICLQPLHAAQVCFTHSTGLDPLCSARQRPCKCVLTRHR
jgi:hypothetical protein